MRSLEWIKEQDRREAEKARRKSASKRLSVWEKFSILINLTLLKATYGMYGGRK